MDRTKRRKIIMSWLAQVRKQTAARLKVSSSNKIVPDFFVFDFSFSHHDSAIEALPCCEDCFRNALGISAETLSSCWYSLTDVKDEATSESECAQKSFESSPERLACHAWMEYFVAAPECFAHGNHKIDLPAFTTIKEIYKAFSDDWKAGLMSGNYRKHQESGITGRQVPGDVEERRPVDEDGAFEASNAEKHKLMASHPPPSYFFFSEVWSLDFRGDSKIQHRRFQPCNWCAALNANMKHASHADDRLFYTKCMYEHFAWLTEWIKEQRRKKLKHQNKAETHPSK